MTRPTGEGITVLVVDDHPVVREGYRRLLEASGGFLIVGEAGSAGAAMISFAALRPTSSSWTCLCQARAVSMRFAISASGTPLLGFLCRQCMAGRVLP